MQYGNMSIQEEVVGEYLGMQNTGLDDRKQEYRFPKQKKEMYIQVNQRDAELLPLILSYQVEKSSKQNGLYNIHKLHDILTKRNKLDTIIRHSLQNILASNSKSSNMLTIYLARNDVQGQWVEQFIEGPIGRGDEDSIVEDWDCYRSMVYGWQERCGELDSYGLKYGFAWTNLCNAGVFPDDYLEMLNGMCINGEITIDTVPTDIEVFVQSTFL
eukprot:TRINITY_DN62499_c0_g1_i3.p1 TRINITY_DN62499_c0_g1~~TRINITY_DN62499_c0_g1_i3.p1  ORF type:complete len:214 (-),score=25.97 TRINITY_DN62499_c0_g1_i3:57-698(-)